MLPSEYNFYCDRFHVAQEDPVIWAEDHLQEKVAALTVVLMGTGLVTAKLVIGRTGATAAEIGAT
jgi:hypothetical protein